MKNKFIIILSLSLLFIASLQAQDQLKVMSLNSKSGEMATKSMFVKLIREVQPDIIAFQEVDYMTTRESNFKGKDFITELAADLGMYPYFGKAINYKSGEYGNAILSRYPIESAKSQLLPTPAGSREQRAFVYVTIELASAQKLLFGSIHLDTSTPEVRLAGIEAINETVRNANLPAVVCGDFNVAPTGVEIVQGMKDYNRIDNDDITFKSGATTLKLDYIFGYPKATVTGSGYFVKTDAAVSDHYPIISVININKSK